MNVRPMSEADSAQVAALATEMGYRISADDIRRRLALVLMAPENGLYVCENHGEVVGWTHVQCLCRLQTEGAAVVVGLFIHPGERGCGVGQALLEACRRWASDRGFDGIRLV